MKKVTLLLALVFSCLAASAQSDMLLYNFNAIPQSLHVNPAYPQQTKVWVGLPAISGYHFHYHNNGFALIDLLERGTDIDSNRNRLIRNLDNNNHITVNQNVELLGLGFKVGKGFVSAGAYQSIDFRMDFPADLLRFVNFGNVSAGTGDTLDSKFSLESFDFETVSRTNIYIGYQHKLMDERLTVGGRFKYIIGQQNTWVQRMNVDVASTDSSFNVKTDALVSTSGAASFIDGDEFTDPLATAIPGNVGFGVDLGIHYKLNKHWNFSVSALDLGSITWKENNRDYVSKGEYSFSGVEVDFADDNPGQGTEYVIDSITKAFDFQEVDGRAYTKPLMSRFFVSANYQLSDRHAFGVLYHTRKWGDNFFHDYSVNYQGRLSRTFQFTASYSVINGTYNNVGAGFDLKLGAIQLYLLSDNILHGIMYENLQTTNLRFGINIALYGRKHKNIQPEDDNRVRLVEPNG
jgi:hypothetical protein